MAALDPLLEVQLWTTMHGPALLVALIDVGQEPLPLQPLRVLLDSPGEKNLRLSWRMRRNGQIRCLQMRMISGTSCIQKVIQGRLKQTYFTSFSSDDDLLQMHRWTILVRSVLLQHHLA